MLSSLTQLKANLLPAAMRARTDFDASIITIANAVHGLFEGWCNRKLSYSANEIVSIPGADCLFISMPRFPLVEIVSVSLVSDADNTTELITDDVQRIDYAAGLLHFDFRPGTRRQRFAIVATGGYYTDKIGRAHV